jgi:hypothetical protein
LGISEELGKGAHAIEGGERTPRWHARLVVDVRVEPDQSLGEIVEVHGSRGGGRAWPGLRMQPCGSGSTWPGGC